MTGSQIHGDCELTITGIADLSQASSGDISFFSNARYAQQLEKTGASAVFVSAPEGCPSHITLLIHPEPSRAFQNIAEAFAAHRPPLTAFSGIHPTSVIHPEAILEDNISIGPYAVIDSRVQIGKNTSIGAHTYIGPHSKIGSDSIIHPHVTIREGCNIGNRVIIQPGAVIGSCGFGYTTSNDGQHTKLEQIGNVEIDDDVEIGANSTIDRARFQSTRIGKGTKIDNLVQIGHAVSIGRNCIIVAQSGVAGSTKIGDYVTIAGQVAIAGHINIASKVTIAGKSGVSKSLEAGTYGGIPVQPIHEYNRNAVLLRKMPQFVQELKDLTKEINDIKESISLKNVCTGSS